MSYSSPGTGFRPWHVFALLGVILFAADIVATRTLSAKRDQVEYASPPPAPPLVVLPTPEPEMAEVIVAARDLPVGTTFDRADARPWVKKRVPKDSLPATFVTDEESLFDRRTSRPVRAGETFDPKVLGKNSGLQLPPGMTVYTLELNGSTAAAGFVVPGSKVDVLGTVRLGNKLHALPVVVNLLVVAIETSAAVGPTGARGSDTMRVSFAVTPKQAQVLALAKTRECKFDLLLRRPDKDDANYDADKVIELLQKE